MASPSSFSLRPAEITDVPAMARLGLESFRLDRNTQVKAMGPNPYDHEQTMKDMLPSWISLKNGFSVVAVDNTTDTILGWVCWGIATGGGPGLSTAEHDAQDLKAREKADPLERLNALSSSNMKRWMDVFMPPNVRSMFVISIAVHPDHQGRGVGSALIRTGCKRADEEGLYIWVHASEAGQPRFARHGFEAVGEFDIDLDEFAIAPPPRPELAQADGKWGHYVFRYMKRLPVATSD